MRVILTFDDGPHHGPQGVGPRHGPQGVGDNYTENVLRTLDANSVQDHIKALFFVQTHVAIRGGTKTGQQLITQMASDGHLVGVHTGSTQDHTGHRKRAARPPYDWNRDGRLDQLDGANALESDLHRAKARIKALTGHDPVLVRPTYGEANAGVRAAYKTLGLHMLLWHVDSRDALDNRRGARVIAANIQRDLRTSIRKGRQPVIVLLHDINATTQAHLDEYLIAIYEAAEAEGKVATFPTTASELNTWLHGILGAPALKE